MSWCGPQPAGDNQLMEDVQPFKFGQSEPQAPVVLSGMDRIGERMARRIRAVLEPMTGMQPRVTGEAVSVYSFSNRTEERRVGKAGVSTCISRRSPYN